jgi:hypothetical protein
VSAEEREAFWEKLYREPGFGIWMGNFRDVLIDASALLTDFMHGKIRERVKNPGIRGRRWRRPEVSREV